MLFNSRELTFYEDGKEVYRTSMKELGYSLDENVLNAQLTAIKTGKEMQKEQNHSAAGEFPYRVSDTEESGKGKKQRFLLLTLTIKREQLLSAHQFPTKSRNSNLLW